MKLGFLLWNVLLISVAAQADPLRGTLHYLQKTTNGWQIHALDLSSGNVRQMTTSPGDKRDLAVHPVTQDIVWRDTLGALYAIDKGLEQVFAPTTFRCSSFTLGQSSLFYTRLFSHTYRRQFLYSAGYQQTNAETLIYRPERGSINRPRLSPSGRDLVFSMLESQQTEVVCIYQLADKAIKRLTPQGARCVYPAWTPDGQAVIYSRETPDQSYDLHIVSSRGEDRTLVHTSGVSEFFPCADHYGNVFFEQSDATTNRIAVINLKSSIVQPIVAGREPLWHE